MKPKKTRGKKNIIKEKASFNSIELWLEAQYDNCCDYAMCKIKKGQLSDLFEHK